MKAGSDNIRSSSSYEVIKKIKELHSKNVEIIIFEPLITRNEYEGCNPEAKVSKEEIDKYFEEYEGLHENIDYCLKPITDNEKKCYGDICRYELCKI